MTGAALARRASRQAMAGMIAANLIGALVVAAFSRWVLPLPAVAYEPDVERMEIIVFCAYLAVSIPLATAWSLRRFAPVQRWLAEERPPTPQEQRLALQAPRQQVTVHATFWTLAVLVFVALDWRHSVRLALDIGLTVALGGITTCTLAYLLDERILRPVAARALAAGIPETVTAPGVRTRILLAWALGTGVPVLGLSLVGLGQLVGLSDTSGERIAATTLCLGALALVVGLAATALSARSIADPVEGVRHALDDVRRGRTDTELEVYDGSEVGLLQAGFNEMVAGLRERERMRDLFGRQVGEDVARAALERGTELGGEVREVGVMFVDLVGSTELAASRPPHEVVELLNELFRVVVAVVADHGGFVNKFEGDAALCVFGAPIERDDPAGAALAAARELRRRLGEELPCCDMGIGVSFGAAVAGNIGAAERFEYTVIGDPVNEAWRLTELAKQRPGRLLASCAALGAAADGEVVHWDRSDHVRLRGRIEATQLAVPRGDTRAGTRPAAAKM
jgi:adenylate cyclase